MSFCKLTEGKAVGCSCVVVTNYGRVSAKGVIEEYFKCETRTKKLGFGFSKRKKKFKW